MYHRVTGGMAHDQLVVSPERFAEQMAWLKNGPFEILPLEDAVRKIAEGTIGKNAVAITFDDGYLDNYQHAFPILVKYGIPATLFVTMDFASHQAVIPRYRTEEPETLFMSWQHIREMAGSGTIRFGSHSCTHRELRTLPDTKAMAEIRDSKKFLEDRLGTRVSSFAYPRGDYAPRHARMVEEAGYDAACTIRPGPNFSGQNLFELNRTEIGPKDTLRDFVNKLHGGFDLSHRVLQGLRHNPETSSR